MYDIYKTSCQNDRYIARHIQSAQALLGAVTSRRAFLTRVAALGVAGASLPLLTACGAGSPRASEQGPGDAATTGSPCPESAELSSAVVVARNAVAYVDESPHADKLCSNCRFFKEPVGDAACGTCEVVGGPIAAGGYCNVWVGES